MKSGFVPTFGKNDIVIEEEFSPETADFRSFLAKLSKKTVDLLFLCLNPGSNSIFGRQLKDFHLTPRIAGCENLNSMDELISSNGGLLETFFATAQPDSDFRKRYRAKFGNEAVISGAAIHYDLTHALDALVREARSSDNLPKEKALIDLLIDRTIAGKALGSFKAIRQNGDQYFNVPLYITVLRADGIRKIE